MNPAFFGKAVPLAGQRKPMLPRVMINPGATLSWYKAERLNNGRWLITEWMRNSCHNPMQVGTNSVCVVDNWGDYVEVDNWGPAWR